MKSFKDYEPKREQTPPDPVFGESARDMTKRIAAAYKGKNSAEMLAAILREAEKNKRAGTLTDAEIDEFYAQFAPLVSGAQRKKLQTVVERLKRI